MATDEERRGLEAQIAAYQRRMNRLQIQKARQGYTADPSIDNEIDDITFTIAQLQRQMDGPRLLPEAREAMERYQADNMAFLMSTTAMLATRQTKQEEQLTMIVAEQHSAKQWRLDKGPVIDDLQARAEREERDAPRGRARNLKLLVFNLVLLLLMFGAIIWLAVTR